MAQKTANTILEALAWIESTAHHRASLISDPGFFVLDGHGDKLRIPEALQEQMRDLIDPGDHFDRRMYRANRKGRAYMKRMTANAPSV